VPAAFEAALPMGAAQAGFQAYPGRPGKYLADIYLLARRLLARAGVTRVAGGGDCTATGRERFYSYRRDGAGSGRQASLIWITPAGG
jgi:copper oxidase (laccase) domain-containing protein